MLCRRVVEEARLALRFLLLFSRAMKYPFNRLILVRIGGTCPTCRRDPVQVESAASATRPAAAEPADNSNPTQVHDDERPSLEPVQSWESDSDERLSTEAESAPAAGSREPATLGQAVEDGEHTFAVEGTARDRNNSSATADENSVLVWSPP